MAANFPNSNPSFTKKDYVDGNTPLVTDYNKALEEIESIGTWLRGDTVPKATTANLAFYVNPSTGNDNNNGSSGSPFKTIAKAVSLIPQIVNHNVTINLADGSYSEGITLTGYMGSGSITVSGNTGTPTDVVLSGQILIKENTIYVRVEGLQTTEADGYGFSLSCNPGTISLNKVVSSTASATHSGVYAYLSSSIEVVQCTFSNRTEGIFANRCSTIASVSNAGSDNTIGLKAWSAVIMKNASQPVGTTAESASYGGEIR
jgi:hypothetical protein